MKMSVDGILNVNKPEGKTSFSVINWLRRFSGEKHVGHTGTLDPFATGVLPVCLGQATKISRFVTDGNKTYIAQIELGISTDTYDRDGKIVEQKSVGDITMEQVKQQLSCFLGVIEQMPPLYSAIKYSGKRLYQLARSAQQVQLKARPVNIISIQLLTCELPLFTIKLECGKGTYIRSIAHDLGQKLGCGAYLKTLTRTKSGLFSIEDSVSITAIEEAFQKNKWQELLYPLDYPLSDWRSVTLNTKQEKAIKNGIPVSLDEMTPEPEALVRAYNSDNRIFALLKYNAVTQQWQSQKIFTY
jgi:tRNA pseudouridine55 synthase